MTDQETNDAAPESVPRLEALSTDSLPLAHDAYLRLLDALTSLAIEPGSRITVDSLARDYKISQTPIREALSRLEAERLVVKHHLRGYRAAPPLDASAFEELFAFRAVIEPAAAAWAAANRHVEDVVELRELLRQMEALAVRGVYGEFAVLDSRLHEAIATAARNRILREQYERMHVHLHLFRVRRDQAVADNAVEEHQLIVDAIDRSDPDVAKAAMRSHIGRSWSRLSEALAG